jgi:hypothetical protein
LFRIPAEQHILAARGESVRDALNGRIGARQIGDRCSDVLQQAPGQCGIGMIGAIVNPTR